MTHPSVGQATRAPARAGIAVPAAGMLANGRTTLLLTEAGTGFTACDGIAFGAWAPDPIEDRDGLRIYLRDLAARATWSLGRQPARRVAERYTAGWRPGRFEIERLDDGIEARLEACVAPDAPFEIRRVTITNRSGRPRRIEVTTCLEVALQAAAAHATHPEFSKLFVQTEFAAGHQALLAHRRGRALDERHPWLAHAVLEAGPLEIETDRARFVGRGGSWALPRALRRTGPLEGATGNVLDPALCLRRAVALAPEARETLTFVTGIGADRDAALAAVESWSRARIAEAFEEAERAERARLVHMGISEARAAELHALAAALMRGDPALRPANGHAVPRDAARAARARHGIAPGTRLVVLDAPRGLAGWQGAGAYLRALGVPCRVLVVADDPAAVSAAMPAPGGDGPHVIARGGLSAGERAELEAAADLVIAPGADDGAVVTSPAPRTVGPSGNGIAGEAVAPPAAWAAAPLVQPNGIGGFAPDGDAYVVRLAPGEGGDLARPPRPWVNVIAGEDFGCLVSEGGSICTWSGNSRLRRLTPWSNDPLLDPYGEAFHLRDEADGTWWSPLPGPSPAPAGYEMRHGFGWSECRHESHGLTQETCVFVPRGERVRIVRVRLRETAGVTRRLSLFSYQRLVLGVLPEETARHVVTEIDDARGTMLARNPAGAPFEENVAFAAACGGAAAGFTCDREAYIGREGGPDHPAALAAMRLDGRAGAGLDPCFGQQVALELPARGTAEVSFLLGDADDRDGAHAAVSRLRARGAVEAALEEARAYWNELRSGVRVKTPAPALDLMVNGWLAYQTLSCRMWGRTAFYQSGGAFGYRDQLQDAAAMMWLDPTRTRAQIVRHAAHQFVEGDVLHWWHPPTGHGIRTRFADDLLWLPFVTAGYVAATGDRAVLDEEAPFLTARALADGEDEAYLEPAADGGAADVYEHCCRAIERSLATGAHGLPLFGSGDWNDSMNRVGRAGRGESVWMAFFLATVLRDFAPLCRARGDGARADRYEAHRARLAAAVEAEAWDGDWYLRGTYDDGTPLGSHSGDECRIDALVQAWSVLSGLADPERARRAMDAVERHLVSEDEGLIRLLDPPFVNTPRDPGYIRGYLAGVRENGGQYTHAALWVVRALAALGRRDRAARLLEMLSPVSRAATPERVAVYQVEPYVIAADVYGAPPHGGRGGWTWYTGSAGWMLRVALESVLGLRWVDGTALSVRPCIPDDWPGFEATLRAPSGGGRCRVRVDNPDGRAEAVVAARMDGAALPVEDGAVLVPGCGDGRDHEIEVVLG